MTVQELASEYAENVRKTLSPTTYKTYKIVTNIIIASDKGSLEGVFEEYIKSKPKLGPNTVRTYWRIFRQIADYAVQKGVIASHNFWEMKLPPRCEPRRPKVSTALLEQLLLANENELCEYKRIRNKAILITLFEAMLRRSEFLNMQVNHLNLDSSTPEIIIERGKGGKSSRLPLSDRNVEALREWLTVRGEKKTNRVWTNQRDARSDLSCNGLYDILRGLGNHAKISDMRCTLPHAFRRGGATAMLQKGIDISTVSSYLRHAKLTTTQLYVEAGFDRMSQVRNWNSSNQAVPEQTKEIKAETPKQSKITDPRFREPSGKRHRLPPKT